MALSIAPGPLPAFAETLRPRSEKEIKAARLDALIARRQYFYLLEMSAEERAAWIRSWGDEG